MSLNREVNRIAARLCAPGQPPEQLLDDAPVRIRPFDAIAFSLGHPWSPKGHAPVEK